jgi:hypothetical protein
LILYARPYNLSLDFFAFESLICFANIFTVKNVLFRSHLGRENSQQDGLEPNTTHDIDDDDDMNDDTESGSEKDN